MKARFVVRRVVDRGPSAVRSLLLECFIPEFTGEDDNDAVANVIFDSQMAVTPSDFALGGIVRDGSIEGAELHIERDRDLEPFAVGDVLDIEVMRVGVVRQ